MQKSLLNRLAIRFGCQFKSAKPTIAFKLLGFVASMTLSTAIYAVGMGGINVTSNLGQVLEADIGLVAVSQNDRADLVARLASPEIYKGVGLEYSYGNKFKFKIESRANGEPYLKVTSSQPINDPFVVMLVELTWPSGRLLREYTFLLDPPGYVAELPVQVEVQPVSPAVQAVLPAVEPVPVEQPAMAEVQPDTTGAAVISEPITQSEEFDFVEPDEEEISPEPVEQVEVTAAESPVELPQEDEVMDIVEQNEEWIAVERGDTLSLLAVQYKPTEISLERMLVALYRANANEFDGKNMNRIRAGKILRMPSQQEMDEVEQSDAVREIRAQVSDWNAYRQKLAGATSVSNQPQAVGQVATGKLASSVADDAPVAEESAEEVLKLSRGEAPGDEAGAGGTSVTLEDEENAAMEDDIAEAKSSGEQQLRTAMLEKNLQEMERLVELKSAAAALAQQQPAETVKEEVKPKPAIKPPVKQESSLMDQILEEPLYLAGGAGILVLLGGLGWIASRRKREFTSENLIKNPDDVGSKSGSVVATGFSHPESGDFTGMTASHATSDGRFMDADPISEADLFLNFGRDVQAEEILKDALQNTPDNHKIHLKLLEIYASRKDTESFAAIVSQLQDSGDEEASQQALAMGREMDSGNPLYGGSADDVPALATEESETPVKVPEVDFDLDAPPEDSDPSPEDDFLSDAVKAVDISASSSEDGFLNDAENTLAESGRQLASSPEDDFLSGAEKTQAMESPDLAAEAAEVLDFDSERTLATTDIKSEKSSAPDLGDLIFEVTGSHPAVQATANGDEAVLPKLDDSSLNVLASQQSAEVSDVGQAEKVDEEEGMEFTLDFPGEEKTEDTTLATPAAEADFAAINLDLDADDTPSASEAGAKDERWQEVATKLDLAKAYQEMGDASGTREILEEVLREGDDAQREAAQSMLAQLD